MNWLVCRLSSLKVQIWTNYLHQGGYIYQASGDFCLFICLSVHLLPNSHKNYQSYLRQNFTRVYLSTRKNWLNLGNHLRVDPYVGFKKKILWHCETGHFITISLTSLEKTDGILMKSFITDKEVSITSWKWSDPDFRWDLPWRKFALSECSCLNFGHNLWFWTFLTTYIHTQCRVPDYKRPIKQF